MMSLISIIFFNNFQLIFKTRNITELDHNFLNRVLLIKKKAKNEINTKEPFQKRLFEPSFDLNSLVEEQYIKAKQKKSSSSQVAIIDSSLNWLKRLIEGYLIITNDIIASVKDRYLVGQVVLKSKRTYFLESLERAVGARSAPLAKGLLFGDISGVSQEVYHSFKVIGILHILSASSANFTIFLHFGLLFWRPCLPYLTKRQQFYLYFGLVSLYFCLVGPAPSTTRAFLTLTFGFFARFVLLRANLSLHHLYFAGIFISYINPLYLQALGFQFSFLASFGILFLYDFLEKEPWIAKNYLHRSLLLTFCAQFFLLPVMVFNFGEINYAAFLANLVVLPLVELLTIMFLASFISLFLNTFFDLSFLQRLLSLLISKLIDILFILIENLEKIPWKSLVIEDNKSLYVIIFILINATGIFLVSHLKKQRYNRNKYRILG